MNDPKGSRFRKWDLHLHTPATVLNNNFQGSTQDEKWDNFIRKLEESDLQAIAVTNYFCINGYEEILQKKGEGRLTNIKLILPNIEFRISQPNRQNEHIHLHVLFSDVAQVSLSKIQDFLNRLSLTNTASDDRQLYCKSDDLTTVGYDRALVNFEVLKKQLSEDFNHLRDYVTIGVFRGRGSARADSGGRGGAFAIEIDKFSDIIFGKEQKDVDYFLKTDRYTESKPKPTIYASDAHELENIGLKFSWIKANATFEGLKQILYEPKTRVKIQEEKPEEKTDYLVIDKVRYINQGDAKTFYDKWIELNNHLNSIIGGKSAGKSLLLYNIAKTIDLEQSKKKIEFCQLTDVLERNSTHDFEVQWKDGFSCKLSDDTAETRRNITYVPQMFINRLVEEKGESSLNNLILDVLLQHEEFKIFYWSTKKQISEKLQTINTSVLELFSLRDSSKQTMNELFELGDKKAIKGEIEKITRDIKRLKDKSGFSEKESKLYEQFLKDKANKEKEITRIDNLLTNIGEFKEYINELPEIISFNIEEKVDEIKLSILDDDEEALNLLDKIHKNIDSSLRKFIQSQVSSEFDILNKYKSKLAKTKEELSTIEEKLKPYLEKFKNQDLLKSLQRKLLEQEALLTNIKTTEKTLKKLDENIKKIESQIIEYYQNLYDLYLAIVNKLQEDIYKKITKEIELKSQLTFDAYKFEIQFTSMLDKRVNLQRISNLWDENNEFVFDEAIHIKNIQATLKKLLEGNVTLRSGQSTTDTVMKLLDDYFYIKYDLVHKGDTIAQMSPGKRGLILLQLIMHLSNAKHPILIDQPEDNLDNRTVFKELNDFIESKKINRQIIMVSHNANLVVSTDSEEVIVANQDGQQIGRNNRDYKFEYVTGALENSFEDLTNKGILYQKGIKEHVCEVLEGGEEAFKKRQRKYAFN